MDQNGITTETKKKNPRNSRKALGRGLKELMGEHSISSNGFDTLPEHVKAARIGATILELVDTVEPRYQPIIFKSVAAYRAVSNEETAEEIGNKLTELERQRIHRELEKQKPRRRWYYLYLR